MTALQLKQINIENSQWLSRIEKYITAPIFWPISWQNLPENLNPRASVVYGWLWWWGLVTSSLVERYFISLWAVNTYYTNINDLKTGFNSIDFCRLRRLVRYTNKLQSMVVLFSNEGITLLVGRLLWLDFSIKN